MMPTRNRSKTGEKGKLRLPRIRSWKRVLLVSVLFLLLVVWYVSRRKSPDEWTTRPLPTDMKGAMSELLLLIVDVRPGPQARFRRLLQSVAPQLPEAPTTTGNEPLKWMKFTFNEHGERVGAVRFRSPLDEAADLRWGFVCGDRSKADGSHITAADGSVRATFMTYQEGKNLDLGVEAMPAKNVVILQPFDGGLIQPDEEYVLWLVFSDASKPVEVHIAIRLEPEGSFPRSTTLEELARDLGVPLPLKQTRIETGDELRRRIEAEVRYRDLPEALQMAQRVQQLTPDQRDVLLWLGYLNVLRGCQLTDNYGPPKGDAHFLAAANTMRKLRDRFQELTDVEKMYLAEAIYFEAESLARMNRKEQAIASLQEALRCGFDASQVEETHFRSILPAAEFHEIVTEFRER